MRRIAARLAVFGVAIVALIAPGPAGAATVEVRVDGSVHSLVFQGDAGEVNTVTLGVVGPLGDPTTYSVSDATAPLAAGPGCSGGGPAGSVATCPLPATYSYCGTRACPPFPPASDVFEINLNDGDDALDSTGITSNNGIGSFSVQGFGGPGADRFVDGPLSVTFTPGPGADTVTGADGYDWVYASDGVADEADLYDLGPGHDTVDYGRATYPVSVSLDGTANDGAPGEGDQILGAEVAKGGSADDQLTGSDDLPVDELDGDGGDDTILGGRGYDLIEGGPGDDTIDGRDGPDNLFGDAVTGPAGDDRIRGGNGRDYIVGEGGADRLSGGLGSDQVMGATSVTRDHAPDRVDCGPSRDRTAYVGPEDTVRRCERVRVSG